MPARAEILDADPLALQVADGPDRLVREQLVAADMHARQHRDRLAGIQMRDEPMPASCRSKSTSPRATASRRVVRHVADVGEAFRPQQILGDVQRRDADAADHAASRSVVVSGGPSSASDARAPRTPAAPAADRVVRKSRRDCMICMRSLLV